MAGWTEIAYLANVHLNKPGLYSVHCVKIQHKYSSSGNEFSWKRKYISHNPSEPSVARRVTECETSYGRRMSPVARRRIRVDYCQNLALVSWSSHSRVISNDSDRLSMCVKSSSSLNISIKARTADRRVAWRRTCQVWTPGQWARRRWDGKMCSDTALEMCLVCSSGEMRGSRMRGNRD